MPSPNDKDASTTAVRALYRLASERMAATPGYVARLRRREFVNGFQRPEEIILVKSRKDPASLYLRWLGREAKDRELFWFTSQPTGRIYVAPAATDTGNLAAMGRRTLVVQDGPHGLGAERYPVGETGVAALIERLGRALSAVEQGDDKAGAFTYLGKIKRPERDIALDAVQHIIPPGCDSGLPKGGQRTWYFDNTLHFPVLVIAVDGAGKELEYYFFDDFLFPTRMPEEEFNPATLGRR